MESTTPPKESSVKRYKFLWRVLLISNLALGAYMFIKKKGLEDEKTEKRRHEDKKAAQRSKAASEVAATVEVEEANVVPETPALSPPVMAHIKVLEPIPDDQQRKLFQWMLEEKRKIKPKNRAEKKQIDQDKAILKQFIRAESIPTF